MTRVLIVRVCAIGDFILNIPALTSLHKLCPNARFTLIGNAGPLTLAREFVPVESVHSIESPPWSQLFYEAVPELKFDEAIVWMKDPSVAENLRLSGIPRVVRADPFPGFGHAADHLLRTLGLEKPELPDLWSADSDEIIVHPGSGGVKKIWPHFESLLERLPNAVVLRKNASSPPQLRRGGAKRRGGVGQENDFLEQHHPSLGSFAASALPSSAEEGSLEFPVLQNLPLIQLVTRLRHCRAYVGNDSGITHLAAYLGCPAIALFGPTDPRVWGPIGRRSRIIWKTKLEDITVNEVLNALHATHARTRIDG
jgi:ADP-heptose:LPS heptosyltransferase